jgi:2-keto-myo-inositol isomerase
LNRRKVLKSSAAIAGTFLLGADAVAREDSKNHNFTFCLNTSTIMKQNLGLVDEIKLAAEVGYDGIEIWMRTLQAYVDAGGKLGDIKNLASDLNIKIEDSIGFAKWAVDDESEQKAAMEQLKKEMGMLAQIGCKRIAAPPFGAT